MTTCVKFGAECVDCPQGCIDDRRCYGKCYTCINNDCDNHPQRNKKVLECSSKGDKRFSALYAKVNAFGVQDSIENHYQKSKRNAAALPVKKGQPVDHIVLNGHKFPAAMLTSWYRLLWLKYLDGNPELVEFARQFDEFTDMFRGKNTVNCQADVIRDYIADREQLIRSAAVLARELRQK